ncbi:MAG: quinolinate synthase NadA [Candidatus Adiutrix sp.]|nr:quinolinate synthase NadA [Candidatus Adiutrix sp.]
MELNDKKKAQFQRVKELAAQGRVEILAHFFQREEVKAAADFVGGAGQIVARAVASQAPAVMVCGASYMTAEIGRRHPAARVLTPRADLSCPLAEAVSRAEVLEAKRLHPEALVVADIKVTPELRDLADLEIAPATAREALAGTEGRELIVLPGPQLADWAGFAHQVVHRWPKAACQVHELALPEELAAAKAEHPEAAVAAHLLCRPELLAMADFVGDSADIFHFCAESAGPEFIIVSEAGLAEYLASALPGKNFHETEAEIFCPNMKLTNLKSMVTRLEAYLGEGVNA